MNGFLILIVVIAGPFFIWQLALLIRDIVKKVKSKKSSTNNSAVDNTATKGKKGE